MGHTELVVGFDLDLTLVDSARGIVATYQAVLRERSHEISDDAIAALIGHDLRDTFVALAPGLDADDACARYRELYPALGVPGTPLLPGARAALDAVHARGGVVHVVSSKREHPLRLMLDEVGLSPEVDALAGGLFGAAKGEYLREVAATIYVGDHPGDMLAARTASALAVGVTTGPHSEAALRQAGADVVLATLEPFDRVLDGGFVAKTGNTGQGSYG